MKRSVCILALAALLLGLSHWSGDPASANANVRAGGWTRTAWTRLIREAGDETVYATADVNVRSGPGTDYAVLGGLSQGMSVIRTGVTVNGWSRVNYQGTTAYVCSDYLSGDQTDALEPYGRLTIPGVGVDVGLYYCAPGSGDLAQEIVDAQDSAAYMAQAHVAGAIIADHNHQGFEAMKDAVPYQTYAYIDFGTYTQTYLCIAIGQGQNQGDDLLDWNGSSLNYDGIPGGLAMYTCNENWRSVTISYWTAVD